MIRIRPDPDPKHCITDYLCEFDMHLKMHGSHPICKLCLNLFISVHYGNVLEVLKEKVIDLGYPSPKPEICVMDMEVSSEFL